ncbi:MAG: helix-turn-helix transcriptional regulator [Acidaminococcaceae bacterium]|nr:helix-turn-helix transcriptional regulator [Acidaminococcaceae bacterium]
MKEFAKDKLFSNLYHLIKQSGKKIGELEVDVGVSPGYISRMNKDANGKPGIDFIIKAADQFNVSIDTLLGVDLTQLSRTERYAFEFIEKLVQETEAENLRWEKETASELNNLNSYAWNNIDYPLFSYETFYEEGEADYPDQVSRVVFNSASFGFHTAINSDCYNLQMQYDTTLYLMNLVKSVHKTNDTNAYAKEIWLYKPSVGCQLLCCDTNSNFKIIVDRLFDIVADYFTHPQLKPDFRLAIDAFMQDDFNNKASNNNDSNAKDILFDDEVPF